jgi:hypothetical protein
MTIFQPIGITLVAATGAAAQTTHSTWYAQAQQAVSSLVGRTIYGCKGDPDYSDGVRASQASHTGQRNLQLLPAGRQTPDPESQNRYGSRLEQL